MRRYLKFLIIEAANVISESYSYLLLTAKQTDDKWINANITEHKIIDALMLPVWGTQL